MTTSNGDASKPKDDIDEEARDVLRRLAGLSPAQKTNALAPRASDDARPGRVRERALKLLGETEG